MPSRPVASCPHELRPGTTVCLHCRRDARATSHAQLRQTTLRVGVAAACVGAAVALVSRGTSALPWQHAAVATTRTAEPVAERVAVRSATHGVAAPLAPAAPPASPVADSRFAPRAAEGRTALRTAGAYATRAGDVVTVTFDGAMSRTRRADKFERIVRATLPEVYGDAGAIVLAAVKPGTLVTAAALTTELPRHGVRLAHPDGGALTLWPETRPGRDGPLVVAYRVTATP